MRPAGSQMSNCFSAAFTQHVTRFSGQASAHRVVFAVDRQLPIGPNRPSKGLLMDAAPSQWSGSIVSGTLASVGQAGQATHGGWLPQERARARPLTVVVGEIRLGEFTDLRECAWPMYL